MDRGMVEPRLVYVGDVDDTHGIVHAALLTNETEMATDEDVLTPASLTQLPFDTLVEIDIVGSLWSAQLGKRVGRATPPLTKAIGRVMQGDWTAIAPTWRGMPVRGQRDVRWAFKERELDAIHALSRDCARWLAEGPQEGSHLLDPALLVLRANDDEISLLRQVLAVADQSQTRARLPWPALEALVASGLFTADAYSQTLGPDAWNALELLRANWLVHAPDPIDRNEPVHLRFHPHRNDADPAVDVAFRFAISTEISRGARNMTLLTSYRHWIGLDAHRPGVLACDHPHLGKGQIVPTFLVESET